MFTTLQVSLAYQVLQIADKLTLSAQDFSLYILDADWENFAVDEFGRVRFIDLEHVLVVDIAEVNRGIAFSSSTRYSFFSNLDFSSSISQVFHFHAFAA